MADLAAQANSMQCCNPLIDAKIGELIAENKTLAARVAELEAAFKSARKAALEEAARAVEAAGWFQNSPDCLWELVDAQIKYSAANIRALGGSDA